MTPGVTSCKFNVFFHRRLREHWWDDFSPPDFRHVELYAYALEYDVIVATGMLRDRTSIHVIDAKRYHEIIAWHMENWLTEIWSGRREVDDMKSRPGAPLTCASHIAHILGVKSALRPIALRRRLIECGFERTWKSPHLDPRYDFNQSEIAAPRRPGNPGGEGAPRAG